MMEKIREHLESWAYKINDLYFDLQRTEDFIAPDDTGYEAISEVGRELWEIFEEIEKVKEEFDEMIDEFSEEDRALADE